MISVILAKKIFELFCYMFIAVLMVRTKLIDASLSVPLARINVYLIITCSVLNAFQVESNPQIRTRLLAAIAAYSVIQVVYVLIGEIYRRVFGLSVVDGAAVTFSNVGNLIIPLAIAIFGAESVVYVCGPMIAFNVAFWSYGLGLFDPGEKTPGQTIRKMFLNPNMIAVLVGMCMFFTGIRVSGIASDVIETIGLSVGPVSFFTMGVSLGGMDMKKVFGHVKVAGVVLMRMIVCPLIVIGLMALTRAPYLIDGGAEPMLVVLMAAAAPSAALVNQFAIMYDKEAEYANAAVIVTTLSSIATMPLIVSVYEMVV